MPRAESPGGRSRSAAPLRPRRREGGQGWGSLRPPASEARPPTRHSPPEAQTHRPQLGERSRRTENPRVDVLTSPRAEGPPQAPPTYSPITARRPPAGLSDWLKRQPLPRGGGAGRAFSLLGNGSVRGGGEKCPTRSGRGLCANPCRVCCRGLSWSVSNPGGRPEISGLLGFG